MVSLLGELFVNNRPLFVSHDGKWYFPTYGANLPGTTFGFDYTYETNYRDLRERFRAEDTGNWMVMPPVPFDPNENTPYEGVFKPAPPSWMGGPAGHWLGTDTTGRDIFARLFYGFRIAIFFSLAFMALTYLIGIGVGCLMGYYGGVFDRSCSNKVARLVSGPMATGVVCGWVCKCAASASTA